MPMFQRILEREREGLIQQGIEQGIKQGIELGKQRVVEQGIQKHTEKIAAAMIREGMGDSMVCRITGLAAERVAEIRRSISP